MISYIAEKVSNLFKVKLMKMLWYSDVLSFIENGRSMTGMVYRHEPMGALPVGHYSLMNLENLSDGEKAILDKVITKFKDYKAKEIVDYMHDERAYGETKSGEIIPFSLAKEIYLEENREDKKEA